MVRTLRTLFPDFSIHTNARDLGLRSDTGAALEIGMERKNRIDERREMIEYCLTFSLIYICQMHTFLSFS